VVFDILLLVALVSLVLAARTVWRSAPRGSLWVALGSLLVAVVAWGVDNGGLLCDPHSHLQGHALWHLLGALATASVFFYYRACFSKTSKA
jgi:hypothetical protein